MRIAFGALVWTALSVAPLGLSPAHADTPSVPSASSDPVARSNLRVRVAAAEHPQLLRLDDPEAPLRRRLTSAMLDYYPFGTRGLHLSGGALRGTRPELGLDSGWESQSRIVSVRAHDFGFRASQLRFAPAMTLGYTLPLARRIEFGGDVGGVIGAMSTMPVTPTAPLGSDGGVRRLGAGGRTGAIAHLGFGYRF